MEILIILSLIVLNGVFSMSEIAVVSVRKALLQQKANAGDAQAKAALELANEPNRFLSTVQIGITLIGILTGAFGGATTAESIEDRLNEIPTLAPYSEVISVVLVVLVTTYLSLVIGELVPKRLGLNNAEGIAMRVARPMGILSRVMSPVVSLLSVSTDVLLKVLRIRVSDEPEITEEEVRAMLQHGTHLGVFDESERAMVMGVFNLDDLTVNEVMTPRVDMVWLDINAPADEIWREIQASGHSRFPVGTGSADHIGGVVYAKTLLYQLAVGQPLDLRAAMQKPLYLPENIPASQALEAMRRVGMKIALVINEYGGIEGLVTTYDILSQIVGEIEPDLPMAVQRDDGSWLVDGMMSIDELAEMLVFEPLPDERNYHTVGGFIMAQIGRVPSPADSADWDGWHFEVMDMDGKRVDKVLVTQARE